MTTRTSFAMLTTAFLMIAGASWAAVPQSLSYQGYLTDRIGSPISDSQTINFAIYTVPIGGVPVWQETKSVAFANGLFSVRLGELTAFPPDLFDVPLWLGMTIGSDSEMEPRRALTTAGFSFRAEDADGLQGRSAAELDQSLHVDDDANPHAVTAGQTGAATQAGLDTEAAARTAGDDAQAAALSTHAAGPAAHHPRYTDAEAVASMGVQSDTNPLRHARYGDPEAVAAMGPNDSANPLYHDRYADADALQAILDNDGAGSQLDADQLDGLEVENIVLLANTGSAFPNEVALSDLEVDGVSLPFSFDAVLLGDFFGVGFDVVTQPWWTGDPLVFGALPIHGKIRLRYRYPAVQASPLEDWLDVMLNGNTELRNVEMNIDDIVRFRFKATPVYLSRTIVGAAPALQTEEVIGLEPTVMLGEDWEFERTGPTSPAGGPNEVIIDGAGFLGDVTLPEVELGTGGAGSTNALRRGELILRDVGFDAFFETTLSFSIDRAVNGDVLNFDTEIKRDGITLLNAENCLVTQLGALTQTGFTEIRLVCADLQP